MAINSKYTFLKEELIIHTAGKLMKRIEERFPKSGLAQIGRELHQLCINTQDQTKILKRPIWYIRIPVYIIILALVYLLFKGCSFILELYSLHELNVSDILQGIESGINEIIFVALVIYFIYNLEGRLKRRMALKFLHHLRSLAHVIDMHQLTKDPTQHLMDHSTTESSPDRELNKFELIRYLDYCSEILAITGKLAALYAQYMNDSVILSAVNDIETTTQNLSNKIWQKIMILDLSGKPLD
ncbi:MAG: hypothetical protein M3Q56_12665 [Bacteroidota bacterium]|nr:hypothetical protein [Bacteroidota bacterium]